MKVDQIYSWCTSSEEVAYASLETKRCFSREVKFILGPLVSVDKLSGLNAEAGADVSSTAKSISRLQHYGPLCELLWWIRILSFKGAWERIGIGDFFGISSSQLCRHGLSRRTISHGWNWLEKQMLLGTFTFSVFQVPGTRQRFQRYIGKEKAICTGL